MQAIKVNQPVENSAGIRATIRIITERDNDIVRPKLHDIAQGAQGVIASMNITDCKMAGQCNYSEQNKTF